MTLAHPDRASALAALERIQALCAEAERVYASVLGPRLDDELIPGRDSLEGDYAAALGAVAAPNHPQQRELHCAD